MKFKGIAIRIAKWLPKDDFNKTQLWQQCDTLNCKETALPDGKRPHVVTSGRLMMHSADGKLNNTPSVSHMSQEIPSSSTLLAPHESPAVPLSSPSYMYVSPAATRTLIITTRTTPSIISPLMPSSSMSTPVPKDTHSSQSKHTADGSQLAPSQ